MRRDAIGNLDDPRVHIAHGDQGIQHPDVSERLPDQGRTPTRIGRASWQEPGGRPGRNPDAGASG